jgi:hypothetical protein
MKAFSVKSLAFYGLSLGFVVTLFGVVTTYGEANLKASPPITGDYSFRLPPSAGCSSGKQVNLFIQQSGIYISAALLNVQDPIPPKEKLSAKAMTLNGQSKNRQFTLEGAVPSTVFCATTQKSAQNQWVDTKIQGYLNHSTLSGKLFLNSTDSIQFTAERLVQEKPQETPH